MIPAFGSLRPARLARAVLGASLAVSAAGSLLLPIAALAQDPAATPGWLRSRLDNRLDPRTRAAVERVIDSARAAGIPSEPLVDKALEGASKRASGDVIVRVVRMLAADLRTAREALGTGSSPVELAAAAQALRGGVDAGSLERLRSERPGQPLVVALAVLSDLIGRGVPASQATSSVLALTKAGIADEQLLAFRREVERDIGIGAPPATAAVLRATSFNQNLSCGGLAGACPVIQGRPVGRPKP